MGRSTKSISLVLIRPALLGSALLASGCGPMPAEEPEQPEDWVVAEDQSDGWGPPEVAAQQDGQAQSSGTHNSGHRSNIGGFIGGYLGSRAASSAMRGGGGVSSAPAGGTAPRVGGSTPHFGGASSRGGFGSSAGHSASS